MKNERYQTMKHWMGMATVCAMLGAPAANAADLLHRYTFDEATGTASAADFYGGANATLKGGAAFTGDGKVAFNGTDAYLELPPGIISSLSNATFEAWFAMGGGANWQRIFDFGSRDTNGLGVSYIFLTPKSSYTTTRFGARRTGETTDNVTVDAPVFSTNVMTHVAVTYDMGEGVAKLFVNGQFVSKAPATQPLSSITDTNNWIGRSQYASDAYLMGQMHEFRIYSGAVSAPQIAANASVGPDNDSGDPGNLTGLKLSIKPTIYAWRTQQAYALADYDNVTNVNVSFGEGTVFSSSDTNVIVVDAAGMMTAFGSGTATITAKLGEFTDSKTITIVSPYNTTLINRYSFNETEGSNIVDSVSGANGVLVNPQGMSKFTGTGLSLSNAASTASTSTSGSFVDLPNGLISKRTNLTIELWVTFVPIAANWMRVFDFGTSDGGEGYAGTGTSYLFLSPRTGTGGGSRVAIKPPTGGETAILDSTQLANNKMSYVAITYSSDAGVANLYIDGVLKVSTTAVTPLNTIVDVNNWLGRSQYGGDQYFNGIFHELRIYEGLMAGADVALSAVKGPDVIGAGAGTVQSISLQAQTNMVGGVQPVTVLANFQNVSNVNILGTIETKLVSDNTNVVTVLSGGYVQAVGPGTATVTASYLGQTSSKAITVSPINLNTTLTHRYSFNEQGGTVVNDSVGGANGTIINPVNASFSGTNLWLNNPANNSATNSYVDLPNGIISRMTNLTIEVWVTWASNFTANWQRVFDFGSSSQGEGFAGTGTSYLLLCPRSGATGNYIRYTMSTNGNASGAERVTDANMLMPQNVETHIVMVYNGTGGGMTLYVNGVRKNVNSSVLALSGLRDFNNWLGRAQYGDPFFNGKYNEFRIYSACFNDKDVVASYAAGPDVAIQSAGIPVAITAQPASAWIGENGTATFSVSSIGTPPLSFQWVKNGTNILANQTGSTLTLSNITPADAGIYSVVISNAQGTVTSGAATLTVNAAAFGAIGDWRFNRTDGGTVPASGLAIPAAGKGGNSLMDFSSHSAGVNISGTPYYRTYTPAGPNIGVGVQEGIEDGYALDSVSGYLYMGSAAVNGAIYTRSGSHSEWARLKITSANPAGTIFGVARGDNWRLAGHLTNGVYRLGVFANGVAGTLSTMVDLLEGKGPIITSNVWFDVGMSFQENGSNDVLKLYFNGQLVNTVENKDMVLIHASDVFHIGGFYPANPLVALFDRVLVWDTAKEAGFIRNLSAPTSAKLSIVKTSPTSVMISWPQSVGAYILQTAPGLGVAPSWQAVPDAPIAADGYYDVTLPISGTKFYRLVK